MEHLFIVTYGKSGSTLLMGLLNSLPGYKIMGENGGILLPLVEFHQRATTLRDKWTREEPLQPAHPWYGIDQFPESVAYERMADLVTETLLRPDPDTTVAGFKEIRWWKAPTESYLDLLENMFPNSRFLLNTRDLATVATRSWWKRDPNAFENLQRIEANLKQAVDSRGSKGFHVHYDDYVQDHSQLQAMCEWLGVDYDEERFERVFQVKHTSHE